MRHTPVQRYITMRELSGFFSAIERCGIYPKLDFSRSRAILRAHFSRHNIPALSIDCSQKTAFSHITHRRHVRLSQLPVRSLAPCLALCAFPTLLRRLSPSCLPSDGFSGLYVGAGRGLSSPHCTFTLILLECASSHLFIPRLTTTLPRIQHV